MSPFSGKERESTGFFSRRLFVRSAVPTLMAGISARADEAPVPRVGKARFTPTLNAYSFLEALNENMADRTKGIDLFGVCDFCVRHDIEAIDLTKTFNPSVLAFVGAVQGAGIPPECGGSPCSSLVFSPAAPSSA